MGCKGSKDVSSEDRKIDHQFETVGVSKFDELFQNASTILKNCEDVREGLQDTREEGEEISGTELLKEGKYIDTLNVLLWSLSAQGKGKINDVGTEVTPSVPYLNVDKSKLNQETVKLYDSFIKYAKTVTEAPEALQESISKLTELVGLIPSAMEDGTKSVDSLEMKAKFSSINKMKKNATKLPKELKKITKLQEVLKTAATDLKATIPELSNLVKAADETGIKASEAELSKPKEIFLKFHSGQRKVEGKTESKPAEKAEAKKDEKASSETKAEEKVETKTETKAEAKPETHVEEKSTEHHAEAKSPEQPEEQSPEKPAEERSPEKPVSHEA